MTSTLTLLCTALDTQCLSTVALGSQFPRGLSALASFSAMFIVLCSTSLPLGLTYSPPWVTTGGTISLQSGYLKIVVEGILYSFSQRDNKSFWAAFHKQPCKACKFWRHSEGQEFLLLLSSVSWVKWLKFADSRFSHLEKRNGTHTKLHFGKQQTLE